MAQKRKSSRKRKSVIKTKKPKVYIPAYRIIILCATIITVCMALLLFTTVKSPDEKPVMTERYEEKSEQETKTEQKTEPESQKVTKTPQVQTQKKNSSAQSTSRQKTENKSNQNSEKAQTEKKVPTTQVPKTSETQPQKTVTTTQAPDTPETQTKSQIQPLPKSSFDFPKAVNNAQLVFVFDDGGQNLNQLKPFLDLPFPVTIAVLPQLAHSVDFANQIRASGRHELILHQPMQAVSSTVNPGPGAIKPEMTEDEITSTLFTNINQIGPIAGLNNHEGSAITADAEKMAVVMKIASEQGIYFLDSRTNKDTQVPFVAKEMGYSYYERNGNFLDNEKTRENALKELRKNLDIANKNGSVIMIGHIWSADFLPSLLQDVYPELKEKGYTFSVVSKSKAKKN